MDASRPGSPAIAPQPHLNCTPTPTRPTPTPSNHPSLGTTPIAMRTSLASSRKEGHAIRQGRAGSKGWERRLMARHRLGPSTQRWDTYAMGCRGIMLACIMHSCIIQYDRPCAATSYPFISQGHGQSRGGSCASMSPSEGHHVQLHRSCAASAWVMEVSNAVMPFYVS